MRPVRLVLEGFGAFKERTVEKRYHAVVQGHPDPSRGTVDAPIDRHPKHDYKWAVVAVGCDYNWSELLSL